MFYLTHLKFSDNYTHSDKEEVQDKKCPFNCRFYDIKVTIPNKNDIFLTSVNLEQIDFYLIFYDLNNIATSIWMEPGISYFALFPYSVEIFSFSTWLELTKMGAENI